VGTTHEIYLKGKNMTEITASAVKDLRDRTGAGMMDAKKALVECNGDMEQAVDYLRKKGLAKAAKKAGRTAAEGLVTVAVSNDNKTGSVAEVNAETDFVSRNDQFQAFCNVVGQAALTVDTVDALAACPFGNGKTVAEQLTENVATIGEHMALRRMAKLSVGNGVVCGYMHNAVAPGMGKIAVLVALEGAGDTAKLQELGKKIAMHVAAANPECLNVADVKAESIEREKSVLRDQALQSGKPADVVEKMIEGRIRKYYEEIVLNEQVFVMDGETKIAKLVERDAPGCKIAAFVRFQLGDGIVVEETDFAAEVAKVAAGA
jgi:elongation factor Ts